LDEAEKFIIQSSDRRPILAKRVLVQIQEGDDVKDPEEPFVVSGFFWRYHALPIYEVIRCRRGGIEKATSNLVEEGATRVDLGLELNVEAPIPEL